LTDHYANAVIELPRAKGTDIAEQSALGDSILAFASLTCQGFASPVIIPRALQNRYSEIY